MSNTRKDGKNIYKREEIFKYRWDEGDTKTGKRNGKASLNFN
jgi:hypothetical protein